MLDVYVMLTGNDEWTFVATVPNKPDFGEIHAACEVLFPNMVGLWIEPAKEETDAG